MREILLGIAYYIADSFVLLKLIKGFSCIIVVPNPKKNKEDARIGGMMFQMVFEIGDHVCQVLGWLGVVSLSLWLALIILCPPLLMDLDRKVDLHLR